ncbi:arrestin, lateral eye-like [Photinus pyralis]|uniref:arrestin, lateral eye-like n=1 Tax=Photinus pyralis TaxID=7054 RepID=UPI001267333F|nr:arrestin, lateral eye-like [Photinus pyralis]
MIVKRSDFLYRRVFKKTSPNNKLTLYLSSRDLVVSAGRIDRLQGVLLVDPDFVNQRKVFGQVTLTFRYGREDEEVMGLKFCNEAVMCLAQLYPPHPAVQTPEGNTPLQWAGFHSRLRCQPNSLHIYKHPFPKQDSNQRPLTTILSVKRGRNRTRPDGKNSVAVYHAHTYPDGIGAEWPDLPSVPGRFRPD